MPRNTAPEPYEAALRSVLQPGEQVVWNAKGSGIYPHPIYVAYLIVHVFILIYNTIAHLYFPDSRHFPPLVAFAVASFFIAPVTSAFVSPNFTYYTLTDRRILAIGPTVLRGMKPGLVFQRHNSDIKAIELHSGRLNQRLVLKPFINYRHDLQDLVGVGDIDETGVKLAKTLSVPYSHANGFVKKT